MHAVIFDFDGTLLHSEAAWDKYLWPLCERTFPGITDDDFRHLTGGNTVQGYTYLSKHYDSFVSLEDYTKEIEAFIPALYKDAPLNEGVKELLVKIQRRGIPMGIATSSRRQWIEPSLHSHEIFNFFQTIVTLDDVQDPKPSPEPYLKAAANLSIAPTSCIAIEDSAHGVQSARAAGLYCIGYAYRGNTQNLQAANKLITQMSDIQISLIEEALS